MRKILDSSIELVLVSIDVENKIFLIRWMLLIDVL